MPRDDDEGKNCGEGEGKSSHAGEEEEGDALEVRRIRFFGNDDGEPSLVSDPLDFRVDFFALRRFEDAHWQVKYLVDSVRKKYCIVLGKTEGDDYDGEGSFRFHVDGIDVSGIKSKHLTNAGLLVCTLIDRDGVDVADIKLVVQVTKCGSSLERTIFNPFEEEE